MNRYHPRPLDAALHNVQNKYLYLIMHESFPFKKIGAGEKPAPQYTWSF